MPETSYPKMAQLRTVEALRKRLAALGIELPLAERLAPGAESPLGEPLEIGPLRAGNRWCIQPMEGWDAEPDGTPSELTLRRWENFGRSGAKLIWGGEAAAVRPDGRANPRQTLATAANRAGLERLRRALVDAHVAFLGSAEGLVTGLQLTHSGRFCRPHAQKRLEPRIAYHHPLLDKRFGIEASDDSVVWTDAELEGLIGDYVQAARLAREVGFDFVDVKACHGYLLHEFLSARVRPGPYGGDFEGRTRLLKTIIGEIRSACPELVVGVRLSAFDAPPYEPGTDLGRPMAYGDLLPYVYGFGCDSDDPTAIDLAEPLRLADDLQGLGVRMLNVSCGSPYYNPHLQRPAIFPPSDGYRPPEDPLVGVARQISVTARFKAACPEMAVVGSGYTYLQEFLPYVAQAAVASGMVDAVGLGRMVLSYPELPSDVLADQFPQRKKICRTFSDCTTAPRSGMVSGCYPLDAFYKARPERAALREQKTV